MELQYAFGNPGRQKKRKKTTKKVAKRRKPIRLKKATSKNKKTTRKVTVRKKAKKNPIKYTVKSRRAGKQVITSGQVPTVAELKEAVKKARTWGDEYSSASPATKAKSTARKKFLKYQKDLVKLAKQKDIRDKDLAKFGSAGYEIITKTMKEIKGGSKVAKKKKAKKAAKKKTKKKVVRKKKTSKKKVVRRKKAIKKKVVRRKKATKKKTTRKKSKKIVVKRKKARKDMKVSKLRSTKKRVSAKLSAKNMRKGKTRAITKKGRKGKKYKFAITRKNPLGGTMSKFKAVQKKTVRLAQELGPVAAGGAMVGTVNGFVNKFVGQYINQYLGFIPINARPSLITTLLAMIGYASAGKMIKDGSMGDQLFKGFLAASVANLGATIAGPMVENVLATIPGMSGVNFTPSMKGINYTPKMNGINYTPSMKGLPPQMGYPQMGQDADFGQYKQSPSDFGQFDSASDYGVEEPDLSNNGQMG